MRVRALHDLAFHLQDEAQHAVRRRVLRAEVDGVAVHLDRAAILRVGRRAGYGLKVVRNRSGGSDDGGAAHGCFGPSISMRFWWTFSSPGSVVMPSQGERKSKLRKSCISFTGSYTTCFRSSS